MKLIAKNERRLRLAADRRNDEQQRALNMFMWRNNTAIPISHQSGISNMFPPVMATEPKLPESESIESITVPEYLK